MDDKQELRGIVSGLKSHARRMDNLWARGTVASAVRPVESERVPFERFRRGDTAAIMAEGPRAGIAERVRSGDRERGGSNRSPDLNAFQAAIKDCVKCSLGKTRIQFVFGEGDPHAKLMFVGEAPGRDEDEQGRPFVGRAGQLLTKIIEAMGLKREEVYIANILKCRPPNNRPPQPDEVEKCWPHLAEQIRLIQPKVLCALGSFAAKALLRTDLPIGALRGKFHDVDGIPAMPTYHPAYLLRNPNDKGKVWDDMKKVRDLLKQIAHPEP